MVDNFSDIDKLEEPVILDFLTRLGLSLKEAGIYLTLIKKGRLTVLELSRAIQLPRTSIYRELEVLKKLGLVEEIVAEHRKLTKAAPLERLDLILSEQKANFEHLEILLSRVKSKLSRLLAQTVAKTEVLFFEGREGIKQLLWNTLSAQEILSYCYLAHEDSVGKIFAKKYRAEVRRKEIKKRDLISSDDPYLNQKTLNYVKESPLFKNYQFRYLPIEKIEIRQQILIYGTVVSLYQWQGGEVFGVEIHNPLLARMQKQIFELLWETAEDPWLALKRKRPDRNSR